MIGCKMNPMQRYVGLPCDKVILHPQSAMHGVGMVLDAAQIAGLI